VSLLATSVPRAIKVLNTQVPLSSLTSRSRQAWRLLYRSFWLRLECSLDNLLEREIREKNPNNNYMEHIKEKIILGLSGLSLVVAGIYIGLGLSELL